MYASCNGDLVCMLWNWSPPPCFVPHVVDCPFAKTHLLSLLSVSFFDLLSVSSHALHCSLPLVSSLVYGNVWGTVCGLIAHHICYAVSSLLFDHLWPSGQYMSVSSTGSWEEHAQLCLIWSVWVIFQSHRLRELQWPWTWRSWSTCSCSVDHFSDLNLIDSSYSMSFPGCLQLLSHHCDRGMYTGLLTSVCQGVHVGLTVLLQSIWYCTWQGGNGTFFLIHFGRVSYLWCHSPFLPQPAQGKTLPFLLWSGKGGRGIMVLW